MAAAVWKSPREEEIKMWRLCCDSSGCGFERREGEGSGKPGAQTLGTSGHQTSGIRPRTDSTPGPRSDVLTHFTVILNALVLFVSSFSATIPPASARATM